LCPVSELRCPAGCADHDGDGYGMGAGCAGLDCNDSDPGCWEGECCLGCMDLDSDYYGLGEGCLGPDCLEEVSRPQDIDYHREPYSGCGRDSTWPVCSKPRGNTPQGLCDMVGNLEEWVQDWYHEDYTGAPGDGSAWDVQGDCTYCDFRVVRGGNFVFRKMRYTVATRFCHRPEEEESLIGFRCVREAQ